MKRLHAKWGDRVQFLDVLTRQAHPGPSVGPYEAMEEKMHDALRHVEEDRIPYPVLVDDVEGRVHQVYGALADPVYLIDSGGRVSLFNKWSNPEALDRAIERLLAQEGYGVVEGGVEPRPAVGQILRDGWPAIRRGLPQSYIDLETAAPGSGLLLLVGHTLKPLLERKRRAPAERAPERRLVPPVALAAGAVAGAAVGLFLFQRLRR